MTGVSFALWKFGGVRYDHSRLVGRWEVEITPRWETSASHRIKMKASREIKDTMEPAEESTFHFM